LAADPADSQARLQYAASLAHLGLTDDAMAQYEQVASSYAGQGLLLKALALCKMVLSLDSTRAEAQRALADLYARKATQATGSATPEEDAGTIDWSSIPDPAWLPAGHPAAQPGAPLSPPPPAPPPAPVDLPHIPLFSSLAPEDLLAVMERLTMRPARAGQEILHEGSPGTSMFVLVQGRVAVVRTEDGVARKVAEMRDGAFFGEMALLSNAPRIASVVAEEDCLLLELTREEMDRITTDHPPVLDVVERFYRERLLDNLLRSSPIFRPFPPERRRDLADRFILCAEPPGTELIRQGIPSPGLFVLLRGRCTVHRADVPPGQDPQLLRDGDVFGEISLVFNTPAVASVRVAEKAVLLKLPRAAFEEVVRPLPEVADALAKLGKERLAGHHLAISADARPA
jgi:CRP-like cAMP-binding protein